MKKILPFLFLIALGPLVHAQTLPQMDSASDLGDGDLFLTYQGSHPSSYVKMTGAQVRAGTTHGLTISPTTGTLTIGNGMTLTVNSSGTLGSAAFTDTSAYDAAGSTKAWNLITSTPTTLSGYGITNAVANTITVNGHALSSNVTVTPADLGLVIGTNTEAWSANLDALALKTVPTGTLVGTSDTQTLSNKTLSSPTITGTTTLPFTSALLKADASNRVAAAIANVDFQLPIVQGAGITITGTSIAANVVSVAGRTGTVTLSASDLTNGTTGTGSVVLSSGGTLTLNGTVVRAAGNATISGTNTGDQTITPTLTGSVTGTASGTSTISIATTIADPRVSGAVQAANNASDFSDYTAALMNLGVPTGVIGLSVTGTITPWIGVDLGDSQFFQNPNWNQSAPGIYATLPTSANILEYNFAEPGQTLNTIFTRFTNGIATLTGTTAQLSGTITLSGTTGLANGNAIAGPNLAQNAVYYYSGTGTVVTAYSGVGQENRTGSVVSSGPFTYTCSSGAYTITVSGTLAPIPVAGMQVSGPDIVPGTKVVSVSGFVYTIDTATTGSTGGNGYVGTPLLATASGTGTFYQGPVVVQGGYPAGQVYNGTSNVYQSALCIPAMVMPSISGTNVIVHIHGGNNSIGLNVSNEYIGTATGTSNVITATGTGVSSNAFAAKELWANGSLTGTVTSNTATSGGTFTVTLSGTPGAATYNSLFFVSASVLSGTESDLANGITTLSSYGTLGTNLYVVVETLQRVYETALNGNTQSYAYPLIQQLNSYIKAMWGGTKFGGATVTGVSVMDVASLPKFQPVVNTGVPSTTAWNTSYINATDGTHPTWIGAAYEAWNRAVNDTALLGAVSSGLPLARNTLVKANLPATTAYTDQPIVCAKTVSGTSTGSGAVTAQASQTSGITSTFIGYGGVAAPNFHANQYGLMNNGYQTISGGAATFNDTANKPFEWLAWGWNGSGVTDIYGSSSTSLAHGQAISPVDIARFAPTAINLYQNTAVTGTMTVSGSTTVGAFAAPVGTFGFATPPAPTVTPTGSGTTTWSYAIVARDPSGGTTPVSASGSCTNAATLPSAGAPWNTIAWTVVPGARYDVYRIVGGATQGKIFSNQTASPVFDGNITADGSTAPTTNTTGNVSTYSTLYLKSGSLSGTVVLSGGTATITSPSFDSSTVVFTTVRTPGGTQTPYTVALSGTTCTITGTATDTSTLNWGALKVNQ